MLRMTRRKLLKIIDVDRIQRAIAAAEKRTSGEIRVSVAPWFWGNIDKAAARAFERMGMTKTRDRNAVLFFVVPSRRSFVVLGDEGIHRRVGQEFWDELARTLSDHFAQARFTEGLLLGVETAGERLAQYFPYDPGTDRNELPDRVEL